MKLYQDGLVAGDEIGKIIVEQTATAGSKNYQLVSRLLHKGASLVQTEDFDLVRAEYDRIVAITRAKSIMRKLFAFVVYKLVKNSLLNKRDDFIAKRIDQTLKHGETAILFIGALHNVKNRLPKSIQVRQIKDAAKVKKYQSLLPFYDKHREDLEELAKYLISEIDLEGRCTACNSRPR
jgi:hypothetical protein